MAELLQLSGAERLKQEGSMFIQELEELIQPSASSYLRQLIVNILSTAPVDLADEVIVCFLQIESPLDINTESDPTLLRQQDSLSSQDPAINALRNFAKYCSIEHFKALEDLILRFHASYEKKDVKMQLDAIRYGLWRGDKPNHYGLPQYALLLALPAKRLSDRGATALRSWRCKFGDLQGYRNPRSYDVRTLVSPIPPNRARGISDANWIKLVRSFMTDQEKRSHFEWRAVGDDFYSEASPERLADTLREAALFMPQRYLQLGLQFPANSPSCFFAALLHAATATEPPENASEDWMPASVLAIETLLEHIHDKMDREIALDFTRVIRSRPDEAWSDTTLYQLRIYALYHPDPVSNTDETGATEIDSLHELEFPILNTVRCTALLGAAHLLWATPGRLNWVKNLAEDALTDSSPAVLAANLELAYAIGKHDLNLACSLLVRACAATNVPIVGTHYGRQLINHIWQREADFEPILTQALASIDEKAVEFAGFWSTIGCVSAGIYQDLAAQAASGPVAARVGVVAALIALSGKFIEHRTECLGRLLEYSNDDDPKVLASAARLVLTPGFLDSLEAPDFAAKFANSAAFLMDPTVLLHALADHEGSMRPFSDAITNSVSQLAGPIADLTRSPARRQYGASLYVSRLLLKIYDESEQNDSLRSQCLDHWDALLRADVGSHQHILTQIDS